MVQISGANTPSWLATSARPSEDGALASPWNGSGGMIKPPLGFGVLHRHIFGQILKDPASFAKSTRRNALYLPPSSAAATFAASKLNPNRASVCDSWIKSVRLA